MDKRVLVVDDSRFVFEEMKSSLKESEFEIVGYCMRGEEVVEAYRKLLPDVVTMDIILPGMDGFEAIEALKAEYPEARIIMVSSLAYDETEERSRELGVQAFVFKPFESEALIDALKLACQS